jgi:L-asparaginase II
MKQPKFNLLPFDDKQAYAQINNPLCQDALAAARHARTREELTNLRQNLSGIEQGVWPLTVALDMKLSGNEAHATRISPEVRGVVNELFQMWRGI